MRNGILIVITSKSLYIKVHGKSRITAVTVESVDSTFTEPYIINCDALITSVGLVPERELIESFGSLLPDWLLVCGNANFVYDIVDGAVMESERTGRLAAEYIKSI